MTTTCSAQASVHDKHSTARWIELELRVDGEAAEAVNALFSEYSRLGTVLEQSWPDDSESVVSVKAYLAAEREAELPRIERALWHLGQIYPLPPLSLRWLSDGEWMEAWKAHYSVQHIGRRIVIKPSWQPYDAGSQEIVIELDPGMAFGTGMHPSTRLCLLALERYVKPGAAVLDAGTGSGILAIAAAKLGAGQIVAIDIDDTAIQMAQENIARNGVENTVLLQRASLYPLTADASTAPVDVFAAAGAWRGKFDLLLMNILPDAIANSSEAIAACLNAHGLFVVSGITEAQEDHVRQALSAAGLTVIRRHNRKDWVSLIGRLSVRRKARHVLYASGPIGED